jgi:hypothetical protein
MIVNGIYVYLPTELFIYKLNYKGIMSLNKVNNYNIIII